MGTLQVQHLVKRLGGKLVVDDISFSVKDGEFFVLLGPSGGGKSTLLRMICGIEEVDEGTILLADRDITRLPSRQRNLAMVFQDYGLYPHMTVYQNIAYGLEMRHLPTAEIERRVAEAARMLGLTTHLQRGVHDLSGGEQQRIALARSLVRDADAFLYDEPLSNLDPKLRTQARKDIMAAHKLKGKPSIYVTHDQNEAFMMGDRVAIIAKGQLQQVGTPDQLLQAPANVFIAGFMGGIPMNTWRGTLERRDGHIVFSANDLVLPLPPQITNQVADRIGAYCIAGLRPEYIYPAQQQYDHDTSAHHALQLRVVDVSYLLTETVVALHTARDIAMTAVIGDEVTVDVGDQVAVELDLAHLHLFDGKTEWAIV